MQRIVFTGTAGSGKTTLAHALSEALGLALAPEAARVIAREWGLASMTCLPPDRLREFHAAILAHQLAWLDRPEPFVADRGVLDTAAHLRFLLPQERDLPEQARRAMPRYTHVIYLPPEFPPVDDGFRRGDPSWARQQDDAIRALLAQWRVPFATVKGSVAERLAAVQELLCRAPNGPASTATIVGPGHDAEPPSADFSVPTGDPKDQA